MSAYLVDKTHIDALVAAGLVLPRPRKLIWLWPQITPDEARAVYPRGSALGGLDADRLYEERRHELTEETAGRVGAMLWAENQRSVNHRYDEVTDELPYEFQRLSGNVLQAAVVVLKAIAGYEYQSCEHPEWESSEARAFCDALRAAAIGRLPGYDDAPGWEITDRYLFLKLAIVGGHGG